MQRTLVVLCVGALLLTIGTVKSRLEHSVDDSIDEVFKRISTSDRSPVRGRSERPAFYDLFVGSGTTIIAAEMSVRRCLAAEIPRLLRRGDCALAGLHARDGAAGGRDGVQ